MDQRVFMRMYALYVFIGIFAFISHKQRVSYINWIYHLLLTRTYYI